MTETDENTYDLRRKHCGICTWWDGERGDTSAGDSGPCRRYPPPPIPPNTPPMHDRAAEDRYPWTGGRDWCGEWTAATDDEFDTVTDSA